MPHPEEGKALAAWLLHKSEVLHKKMGRQYFLSVNVHCMSVAYSQRRSHECELGTSLGLSLLHRGQWHKMTDLPPTHIITSSHCPTLKPGKFPLPGMPKKEENHWVLPWKLDALSLEVDKIFSAIFSSFELIPVQYRGTGYLPAPRSSTWCLPS